MTRLFRHMCFFWLASLEGWQVVELFHTHTHTPPTTFRDAKDSAPQKVFSPVGFKGNCHYWKYFFFAFETN